MPRSFLVKKKGDRIFRSYRSDGSEDPLGLIVGRESPTVATTAWGCMGDLDGSRWVQPSTVWPLVSDEVRDANDVIRGSSSSDLFFPLPALVQPLAIRVKNNNNHGYVFDSTPFLFPRRFPFDGSPFYSTDRCTTAAEVIQPIDLLSHRALPLTDCRSKVVHRKLDATTTRISTTMMTTTTTMEGEGDLTEATVELKSLECCTTTITPSSSSSSSGISISPISPHSSNNSLDFSPKSATQRSEASSAHSISSSSSNHGGSTSSSTSRRCNAFQDGITVGYTYDAFFVSDGRSRRRNALGGIAAAAAAVVAAATASATEPMRQRYKCSECGKHYATSSNLSRHKQTHRSLDSQQAKQCPHCHKVYVSMPALSMHILTHDLKYQCNVCAKAFSRPWLLQGHLRSHTGEKPFGCAHCGKAFADRSNLRAHMQTHSSFKLYTCKRCNKSFALKAYLNKHLESACFKDNNEEGEVEMGMDGDGEDGDGEEDDCCSETSIWSV